MVPGFVDDDLRLPVARFALHPSPGCRCAFFDAKQVCGLLVANFLDEFR